MYVLITNLLFAKQFPKTPLDRISFMKIIPGFGDQLITVKCLSAVAKHFVVGPDNVNITVCASWVVYVQRSKFKV